MVDILVVCDANVARSPLLGLLLRAGAEERLGPGVIDVASAGTRAQFGTRAFAPARQVAARWGLSLDDHHAMPLAYVDASAARLVVTMTRRQRREVARRHPDLEDRIFLTRQLDSALRSLTHGPAAARPPGYLWGPARMEVVLAQLDVHRPAARTRRMDIADPSGRDLDYFERMAQELRDTAELVSDALFGPRRPTATGP